MKKIWIFLFALIGITSIVCMGGFSPATVTGPPISNSLVFIDARVTDGKGNYVQGLKAEDFELYQDGTRHEIAQFYAPDPAKLGMEARKIIFIIDDLGLPKDKFKQVRTALRHFADKVMRPTDLAGLACTAGGGAVLQPLTSDAGKFRASADQWQWSIQTEEAVPKTAMLQSLPTNVLKPTAVSASLSSPTMQTPRMIAVPVVVNQAPVQSCSGST